MKAQIKRLVDLEIISEDHSTDLYKLYSAKGWTREEPLDREWPITEPRIMADAMNLIVDSGVRSKADLLTVEFTMSPGDVENLTSLPPGWFSARTGEVVYLKRDAQLGGPTLETPGVIVPFTRK